MKNRLQPGERTFRPPNLEGGYPDLIVAFPDDLKEVSLRAYLDSLAMNLQELADQLPEREALALVYRVHGLDLGSAMEIGATVVANAEESGLLGVVGALSGFPAKMSSQQDQDQAEAFNEQTLESVLLALQPPSEW
ncbi:MAG: hypothetical protein KJZ69_09520 [Phycisphaerales bacterium]|nr:hypothetical protein [Phycisphaerales bacterium]